MNYTEAYNFLISLSNIPRDEYIPKNKLKQGIYLKRLQFLLDLLGNPEKKIPHYIHITGTSGKGSVSLMLSKILQQTDKKIGLITSPHPSVITERWEINGKNLSKKDFIRIVKIIKEKLDIYLEKSPYELPSFFEITTAIGFYYFAEQKIDWGVIEVGLGGKNDSTNIIPHTDISVITHIAKDHLDLIGPTKKDIAKEKSGIIKKNSKVFTMEKDPNILQILEKEARKCKTKLQIIKKNKYILKNESLKETIFEYKNKIYKLRLLGQHQINNAILVIEICKHLNIDEKKINNGLQKVKLPLRLEIIEKNSTIILDGAHNPDKMKTTINAIQKIIKKKRNLFLIIGFSNNKDVKQMVKYLVKLKPKTIFCTRSTVNPARKVANPILIREMIKKLTPKTKIETTLDPQIALKETLKEAKKNDLILITGSIFLSGELRTNFKKV